MIFKKIVNHYNVVFKFCSFYDFDIKNITNLLKYFFLSKQETLKIAMYNNNSQLIFIRHFIKHVLHFL